MSKLKYFIVCCGFLFACKNDQTNISNAEGSNGSQEANAQNGNNQSTFPADGSSPSISNGSTDVNSSSSIPSADNAITNGSTTANANPASNPTSAPPSLSSSNTDAPKISYGKSKVSETLTTIMADDTKYGKGASNLPIPDPCTMISLGTLNSTFGLTSAPEIKSGSRAPRPAEKSCFFKFGDSKKPNAGIMLQIMTNPYPEEIEDYPALVIDGKLKDGEQSPYDKTSKKFKPWNELGDAGCYSYEAGKYHWKIGSKYVFLLAFNTDHSESQQKQIAASIGREIMKNFATKIK